MFLTVTNITVLSLDPSYNATGWAVLSYDASANRITQVVACGWIETRRDKKTPVTFNDIQRIYTIAGALNSLLDEYTPDVVCSEIPLGSQSASAAKSLGIAKGIVTSICCVRGATARYINPLAVKLAVCGKRNAEKSEVILAVEKKLKEVKKLNGRLTRTGKFTKLHEARCDAIAVGMSILTMNGKFRQWPEN